MSNIYNLIKEDIGQTINNLLSSNVIINPTYNSEKHCKYNKISSNREESGIDKHSSYVKNFMKAYNKREYIFMFHDNSFIQLNYEFVVPEGKKEKVVSKANLCFFPNPGLYSDDIINDLQSLADENEMDELHEYYKEYTQDFEYASNYIRLDYDGDENSFTEFIHPRCHIHIGLHNNFRLGVNKLPLLSEFVDFVLYVNYIEKWKEFHSNGGTDLNNYIVAFIKQKKNLQLTSHKSVLTSNEMMHYLVNL